MRTLALDANVLVYAAREPETARGQRAEQLLLSAPRTSIVPAQVLGEFANAMRKHRPDIFAEIPRRLAALQTTFVTPTSEVPDLVRGAEISRRYQLQFWDSVIWSVAERHGAAALLSEDMQDGFRIGGLEVIDPFADDADERLAEFGFHPRS